MLPSDIDQCADCLSLGNDVDNLSRHSGPANSPAVNQSRERKSSHIPSLPVLECLLLLLYLAIVCDVIYVLGRRYLVHLMPRSKIRQPSAWSGCSRRERFQGRSSISQEPGVLTLDRLWQRMKAEARNFQDINLRHQDVTRIMMESRLRARNTDTNCVAKGRGVRGACPTRDHTLDMVRWAARISTDHRTKGK